jgi:hypothetical protein
MNITEYVKLGFSNFVPAGPELESKRPIIRESMEKLVDAFGIEYGVIHPEWFLTEDDEISFGEVANRIPGGHIFELISKVYGFDAIRALIMCSDPDTTQQELKEDSYFEDHTLVPPSAHKVSEDREGFGNHYGTIFFRGDDPQRMTELLRHYQSVDFYV